MKDDLQYLLDPDEWDHGIEVIRGLAAKQIDKTILAKTITELIIAPLESYSQKGWEKTGNRHNTGTQAAMNIIVAAEDVIYDLKNGCSRIDLEMTHHARVSIGGSKKILNAPSMRRKNHQLPDILHRPGSKTKSLF
jgi:hypothetical protein